MNCPICFCPLEQIGACTPCGHLFCVPCIEHWVEEEREQSRSPLIKCPVCRHTFHAGVTTPMGVPYEFRPFCMPALRKVFLDNASHVAAESALTQTQIALQESEGERRAALLQIEEMRMQLTLYDKIGSDAQQEVLRLSTELRMKEEALAQQQQRLAEKQREVYSIDGQLHDVEQRLEAMTIRSNEQELGVHTLEEDLREARAKIVEQAKTVDTLNGKLRDTDQNSLEKDRALVEKDRALVEKDRALMEKDCALRAAASKNSSRKQSTPQAPERVNRSRRKTSLAISNRDSKALSDAATNGLAQDSSTTPAADVIGSASPPNDLLDSENIPRTCTEQKEHEWTRQGTNQHVKRYTCRTCGSCVRIKSG